MMALEGIRVLDLSRILTGPYCTMMLADMGAEVFKLEPPGTGDDTRTWGPPFVRGMSTYFISINRNKKSFTLNLKHPRGKELLQDLVRGVDVLVENFRPGTMAKLGLGYETLQEINPRLVYCAVSGFGLTGPYRDRPGYDVLAQAMGGMMSVTGEPEGDPVKAGMSIADIGAGMFAAFGILAALMARERTGRGQLIDTSLLESQLAWHTYLATNYLAAGKVPGRLGTAHPSIVPYQGFKASDQHFIVAVGNDGLWRRFCQVAGLERLADDERYRTNPDRVAHREELLAIIGARLAERTAAEWVDAFLAAGVPAGPICSLDQVYADPHVLARDMIVEMEHPEYGQVRATGIPLKLSATPGRVYLPPPTLGEHTAEVLGRLLNLDAAAVADLRAEGVL